MALNAGSSSLKFGVFRIDGGVEAELRGTLGEQDVGYRLTWRGPGADEAASDQGAEEWSAGSIEDLAMRLLAWLDARGLGNVAAVGHRVVHGGPDFRAPVRVDATVLARLDALVPLAPLHQPASLAPIRRLMTERPDLPQIACFDTAFHHLAPPAGRYALPRALEAEGVRRYGFHGLSYQAVAAKLRALDDGAAAERVVVAHLGSGASLCALRDLRSIDTTMGFTALDGLMMGTRPGSLDPGILLYLLQQRGYRPSDLERLLYHESGLLGVSGESADVAALLGSSREEAREALDLFAFRVAREAAAMASTLGGLDRLVFTGGIGEHAAPVRAMIGARLAWLGLALDEAANRAGALTISAPASKVTVQLVATDEEGVIAQATAELAGPL